MSIQSTQQKVLFLTLKKKWFDMILEGVKKEEYREIKEYWIKRLVREQYQHHFWDMIDGKTAIPNDLYKDYTHITFKNGYSVFAPEFTIEMKGVKVGLGVDDWGAGYGRTFILTLGYIVSYKVLKPTIINHDKSKTSD